MSQNPSIQVNFGSSCPPRQEQGAVSKDGSKLPRGSKTICVYFEPKSYPELVNSTEHFRDQLDKTHTEHPELFPDAMGEGYTLHDSKLSAKLGVRIRRIKLKANGEAYAICPSFMMPYMVGLTADVEHALFLHALDVPFWALTHVFGHDDMYWYRITQALGRNSIIGTTVKYPDKLPKDLACDEKHTKHGGKKVYAATTVGGGCILGAAMCKSADSSSLTKGYGVFAKEAHNLDSDYRPETANTDGWGATGIALKALFPAIVIIRCFLHAFIKVRERCKKLGDLYNEISTMVWDAYHAPTKRAFSQRIRRLREWAQNTLEDGVVLDKLLSLCDKSALFAQAYDHPNAHRTSNMVDRLMRWQDQFLFNRQYFHRSWEAAEMGIRAWAILRNYRPYCPRAIGKRTDGVCAAERLNGFRYCDNWLENLRVSSSMNGYRR